MDNIVLTSENFLKIIDISNILLNEVEVIELYGLTAFNRMSEHNCIFIVENIYSCDNCDELHLDIIMVNYFGRSVLFTLDVNSLDCYDTCQVYDHDDEKRFLYSCGSFSYDPITKHLEMWEL